MERGTVGFRLTPTRVVAKRKLSQNRTPDVVETVIAQLTRRRSLRERGPRRRDAPRPRRDGPVVTAGAPGRGEAVGTIRNARIAGGGRELLPTEGPFDVFLEEGAHRRHRTDRCPGAPGRGARRAGLVAGSGALGPPRARRAVGARVAAGGSRVTPIGRARGAHHGGRAGARRMAGGSARASAMPCGPTSRASPCSMRPPATSRRT